MDFIKTLLSPNTKVGRIVRTMLQALIGITAWVYGFLSIPGVQPYLTHNNLVSIGSLVAFIGVITVIHNYAQKVYDYLKSLLG